ncbi:NUDIX domain-containing protein [Mycobacterium colombiense]
MIPSLEIYRQAQARYSLRTPAVIVDVDGTLVNHRGQPIAQGIAFARRHHYSGRAVLIVTARHECLRKETTAWLRRCLPVPFLGPFHRRNGDTRADAVVKREIYEVLTRRYAIHAAIDDLATNLQMWRELGLNVEAVAHSGDGWVDTPDGPKWGPYGAAGLLLRANGHVLLQYRTNCHHADTWGLPGGARQSHETAEECALREAAEETGIDVAKVTLRNAPVGYATSGNAWSYATVLADTDELLPIKASAEGLPSWVAVDDVASLPLHPDLALSWPELMQHVSP